MSEEDRSSSKRRRVEVEEGSSTSSATSVVPPSSSMEGASTSTAGSSPNGESKVIAVIKKRTLRTLLREKSFPLMIIDVRESQCYKAAKICSSRCANLLVLDISEKGSSSDTVTCESKRDAITILEKYCPGLLLLLQLRSLRRHGNYPHFVILDDKSTAINCSKAVRLIYDVLKKFFEDTETSVFVLQGGFLRFSKKFPDLVVTSNETAPPETPTLNNVHGNAEDLAGGGKETVEKFLITLRLLDKKLDVLRKLITLKAKVKALESLELMLRGELEDEKDKLVQNLETSFPEESKCPVCMGIFLGEIVVCGNGHSICASCCEQLATATCPKCRVPYREKVRNWALEYLLQNNSPKVECICGDWLGLREVETHVQTCVNKSNTGMELGRVKRDRCATTFEFGRMIRKRQEISERIVASEGLCCLEWNRGKKVSPSVLNKLWESRSAKMSSISSHEKTLYSMSFSNP